MFCSCRCHKSSRSKMLGLAAPKSLLKGLNSMQLDRLLGLGSLRLTRFDPNTHAPPKDPFLVLPAPQFRPLVNTLYHHPLPQSSLFSLLTLFNHIIELQVLLWFQKALDLRLLWYPILTVACAPVSYSDNIFVFVWSAPNPSS